jgi:hypothetical protein
MFKHTPAVLLSSEPDVSVLEKLATVDRLSIAAVLAIAVLNLAGWCLSFLSHGPFNSWHLMTPGVSSIVLMAALSLQLSGPRSSSGSYRLGMLLALVVTVLSGGILVAALTHLTAGSDTPVPFHSNFLSPAGLSAQSVGGFVLLGLTILLMKARKRPSSLATDIVTVALFLTVMILASAHLIATLPIFGPAEQVNTSAQAMVCLLLLAAATIFRRAQHGVLSILTGRGMGSKIARTLSPILMTVPYLREAGRARFVQPFGMPADYPTAILTSLNVFALLAVLFFMAWRINCLEKEINDLSLRDGLTAI